jgi:tRNA A-37 threonylcarbamoyl transferase component Bud32
VVRCGTCNAELPDGAGYCTGCGTPYAAELPTVPDAATQNVARPPPGAADGALPPTDGELGPGTHVGEYLITGVIGRGGMGTVYAGVHPVIGKQVAIKMLKPALSAESHMVGRFVQEARAVNQIGNKHIVDIFAFGQVPGSGHYFVMELLHGQSLAGRLAEGKPFNWDEALTILVEITTALSAAHGEGIVHRDLKPDNIYLSASKCGDRQVKLLDFGIAKLLKQDQALSTTQSGVQMGTPYYMSPEQCLGKPLDARADLYALGVVMFEMFTGGVPFPARSQVEAVTRHIQTPPPSPSDFVVLPEALEQLIMQCLAKDPAARPQSAAEARRRIEKVAAQLGADAEGGLRESRARRPKTGPIVRRAKDQQPAAAPPAARRGAPLMAGLTVAAVIAAAAVVYLKRDKSPPPAAPPAPLALQVLSTPSGAQVIINGALQALRTPGTFTVPRGGQIDLRLEKEGFTPLARAVDTVTTAEARTLELTLEPLAPKSAHLQVRTNARSARWLLNGVPVGDASGALFIESLPPGKHIISIEAPGFIPRSEPIHVHPDEHASIEWTLGAQPRPRPVVVRKEQPAPSVPAPVTAPSAWPPK